jgi:hypothetical protein
MSVKSDKLLKNVLGAIYFIFFFLFLFRTGASQAAGDNPPKTLFPPLGTKVLAPRPSGKRVLFQAEIKEKQSELDSFKLEVKCKRFS